MEQAMIPRFCSSLKVLGVVLVKGVFHERFQFMDSHLRGPQVERYTIPCLLVRKGIFGSNDNRLTSEITARQIAQMKHFDDTAYRRPDEQMGQSYSANQDGEQNRAAYSMPKLMTKNRAYLLFFDICSFRRMTMGNVEQTRSEKTDHARL